MTTSIAPSVKCSSKYGRERCRVHGNFGTRAAVHSSEVAKMNIATSKRELAQSEGDWDRYAEARDQLAQDERIYDATLLGQQDLSEAAIKINDPFLRREYETRLQAGAKLRTEQLKNDGLTVTRKAHFQNLVSQWATKSYRGLDQFYADRKELGRLPNGTPIALLLKDGSTIVAKSSDGIIGGRESLKGVNKLLNFASFIDLPLAQVRVHRDDIKNARFNLLLRKGIASGVVLEEVQELHVLRADALDRGIEPFLSPTPVSDKKVLATDYAAQSDYVRIVDKNFLFEGEIISPSKTQTGWGSRSRWGRIPTSYYPSEHAFVQRVVVPA